MLGVTHSDSAVHTAIRRKGLGLRSPIHLFLFLPAFCSNFPGVLAPHEPTSGIPGKWWLGQERPVSEPEREAGRKGGGRSASVSASRWKCPLCPLALQPWALGDGFFRRLTWASRGLPLLLGPCFNGWFSPVINYSSVWPDLVSNNSSHFEMHVGALFCFSLLFLLTFGEMEVLVSVEKPRSPFSHLFPSDTHLTALRVQF